MIVTAVHDTMRTWKRKAKNRQAIRGKNKRRIVESQPKLDGADLLFENRLTTEASRATEMKAVETLLPQTVNVKGCLAISSSKQCSSEKNDLGLTTNCKFQSLPCAAHLPHNIGAKTCESRHTRRKPIPPCRTTTTTTTPTATSG